MRTRKTIPNFLRVTFYTTPFYNLTIFRGTIKFDTRYESTRRSMGIKIGTTP